MVFGNWVRDRRMGFRMTATECASRAGMKLQQWNRMEKIVEHPEYKTALAVAAGLGLSAAEVLEAAGYPAPAESAELDERRARVDRIISRVPNERFDAWYKIAETAADVLAA